MLVDLDETIRRPDRGGRVHAVQVVVVDGADRGRQSTASERVTVGTSKANDLVLTDPEVSRYHLELVRFSEGVQVLDHGSTNGTFYQGARIERGWVDPGSILELGRTRIRIEAGSIEATPFEETSRLGALLGESAPFRRLMTQVHRLASASGPVLLLGEAGTGKSSIARAIHELSPRRKGPFESFECGGPLPTLVASELFGHEPGAFEGAKQSRQGVLERAASGSLVLEEIGELPSSAQSALLAALEQGSFRRLGGLVPIPLDARVLATTTRDIRAEVNKGIFRPELYYRLAAVTVTVPPLRDRADDVPVLVAGFLRRRAPSAELHDYFPDVVVQAMKTRPWPGNLRELENAVEAAWLLGEVPPSEGAARPGVAASVPVDLQLPYGEARDGVLDRFEDLYVRSLLESTSGNVAAAARRAGMNRSYLTKLLRRRGIRGRTE